MSFGWSAATWLAVSAGATAVTTLYSADQGRKLQNTAQDRAREAAQSQQLAADEANNRASAKSPDTTALMAANLLASKSGQAGTLLTGPGGLDAATLKLGKASALGGG